MPTGSRRDNPLAACELDKESQESDSDRSQGSFRKCDGAMGNACFATGTVGFMIASVVVNGIATGQLPIPQNPNSRLSGTKRSTEKTNSEGNGSSGSTASEDIVDNSGACSCGKGADNRDTGGNYCRDTASMISRSTAEERIAEVLSNCSSGDAMPGSLVDAHCHLQLDPIYSSSDDCITLAGQNGISKIAVCGTCPGEDWHRLVDLYMRNTRSVLPHFGLHPWWISKCFRRKVPADETELVEDLNKVTKDLVMESSWENDLEDLLQRFPEAGVGECGLDKVVKKEADLDVQVYILKRHLHLAGKYKRPVTIHCVSGCWGTLLQVLNETFVDASFAPHAVILHSCHGLPINMLSSFARLPNVYFSLSSGALQERYLPLVTSIPLDRLLLETDSPDQIPYPLRGSLPYNEPVLIKYICHEIAKLRGINDYELADVTTQNAFQAFKITA